MHSDKPASQLSISKEGGELMLCYGWKLQLFNFLIPECFPSQIWYWVEASLEFSVYWFWTQVSFSSPSNINLKVWRHRWSTTCLCCIEAFAITEKNIMRSDGGTFFWALLKFWWKNTEMKMDIKHFFFAPQNLFNYNANTSRTHRRAGLFTLQGQKIYRMCSVA